MSSSACSDISKATYQISVGSENGTAFCVNYEGRLFFVSDKHIFNDLIFRDNLMWAKLLTFVNSSRDMTVEFENIPVYFTDTDDMAAVWIPFSEIFGCVDVDHLSEAGISPIKIKAVIDLLNKL